MGANASGKSNLRDAFRFLHGIGRGYSLGEIIGEAYGNSGEKVWEGIRGGNREIAFQGEPSFHLGLTLEHEDRFDHEFEKLHPTITRWRYDIEIFTKNNKARVSNESLFSHSDSDSDPENSIFHSLPIADGENSNEVIVKFSNGETPALNTSYPLIQQSEKQFSDLNIDLDCHSVINRLESMRFFEFLPYALRRPSQPGIPILKDGGGYLPSVLQLICQDDNKKTALISWITALTPMDVVDLEFREDLSGKIVLFLKQGDGSAISASSASDGTLRFLGMLAALLGPRRPQFIFLEEVDTGIHPTRLHLLVELLERETAKGDLQIVATTHAPHLLTLLSPSTLENTSLIYRLPEEHESRITRILEIPTAREVLTRRDIARLFASGWLENSVYFASGGDET
ncbi:MAG: ATP-binding protein [Magnetococcales bacterium]|nr:ATP-binding protein [Magnetococcales bacterium]